jgi:methylthioribulose 1-phosphate dehydratase/enolase-phosphatase E1
MSNNNPSTTPGAGWSNGDVATAPNTNTSIPSWHKYNATRRWISLGDGWTRIGNGEANDTVHSTSSQAQLTNTTLSRDEQSFRVRCLIAQLCERFYEKGWATGTGGGMSIRVQDPEQPNVTRVFVAPSGIQKEDMIGNDIFELDMNRTVVTLPVTQGLKQSACTPLWYVVYKHRPTANCVIHTHSMNAQLATLLDEHAPVLRITHLEMLKGVGGHAYDDMLEIPIIDNRPSEDLLAAQLERAVLDYPRCNAVLVRRHGIYVWGDSWEQAKTQCESFDYLLESALRMRQMNMDPSVVPATGTYRHANEDDEPAIKRAKFDNEPSVGGFNGMTSFENALDCTSNSVPLLPRNARILVLDVEGCTTSISFVKDVLYPYVVDNIDEHVRGSMDVSSTEYRTLEATLQNECPELPETIDVASLVKAMVQQDVKSAALKDLQGTMWKTGYESGELKGHVYSDVKPALEWMKENHVEVYIYSSGSVQAQKLLFGNSIVGDLLPYIAGHFDITTAGIKKDASSYRAIADQLGVPPSKIVFCSDSEAELVAAKQAGIGWPVMSIRPGNVPLTSTGKTFPPIFSLLQLCGEGA